MVRRRGRGLGTALVEHAPAADGVLLVEVKTQDLSAGYAPYEATNAFWQGRGFVQVDMIDPLPGWAAGNPGGDPRRGARHYNLRAADTSARRAASARSPVARARPTSPVTGRTISR